MEPRTVILSAVRTPIGKFMGGLSSLTAVDLGVVAAQAALERAGVPAADVQETILGHARQAGGGPNGARQVSIRAGIPDSVPAWTLNQACASGLTSLLAAHDRIRLGEATVILAGGMESMSRVPYLLPQARTGYRMGDAPLVDAMYQDGFACPLAGQLMGATAETLATKYDISREEQDEYAAETQNRSERARAEGKFEAELVPVTVPGRKGDTVVSADEHPRDGVTAASLAKLPPVFAKDGTVTAGNSSGITDGAAALVLMAESEAERRGLTPLARLESGTVAGVDPHIMGIGPVPALAKLEARTGRPLADYELVELNEAFAAQVLAVDREVHFDRARLNVNGGAISLGHPIGCSGARIAVTLLHEMQRRDAATGVATLCVSGGMGAAVSFVRK